jgi:hypothetical protein
MFTFLTWYLWICAIITVIHIVSEIMNPFAAGMQERDNMRQIDLYLKELHESQPKAISLFLLRKYIKLFSTYPLVMKLIKAFCALPLIASLLLILAFIDVPLTLWDALELNVETPFFKWNKPMRSDLKDEDD